MQYTSSYQANKLELAIYTTYNMQMQYYVGPKKAYFTGPSHGPSAPGGSKIKTVIWGSIQWPKKVVVIWLALRLLEIRV